MDKLDNEFYNSLGKIGLTELQARIIIALMEMHGDATAPQIYNHVNLDGKINRTSVYTILNDLLKMGLVLTNETNKKSKQYTLVSQNPDELVRALLKPQQPVLQQFKTALEEAKNSQVKSELGIHYSLKGGPQIMQMVTNTINSATDYLLIMANIPMLSELYPIISEKIHTNHVMDIMILATWNPDPNIDQQEIIKKYRQLLGKGNVTDIFSVFERIKSLLLNIEIADKCKALLYQKLNSKINFVQVMSEDNSLIGSFLNDEEYGFLGSGSYTHDPITSQIQHILFFTIFENDLSSFNNSKMEKILKKKISGSILDLLQIIDI